MLRTLWAATLTVVLVLGLVAVVVKAGWLPFGQRTETHDSQIIQAVQRTQEVSLLSLSIQGITEKERQRTIFGQGIPGSTEKLFLQYDFSAKLGIDGAQVKVVKEGETAYQISIPKFIFIGYEDPTFKVAAEDGGPLRFVTADIDKVGLINDILSSDARDTYISENQEVLRDQAKAFYEGLISGIKPDAEVTFSYSDDAASGQ